MNFKKLGLSLLTVATLGASAVLNPIAAWAADDIVIGGNLELTGDGAAYGSPVAAGMDLLFQQKNDAGGILGGRHLKSNVLDNQSKTTEAVSVASKLVNSNNVAAVGPTKTGVAKASLPVMNDGKLPIMFSSTTGDGLTQDKDGKALDYAFRVCFEDRYQGLAAGAYSYNTLGAKKAVIITDQALDYSQSLAEAFEKEFTQAGGEIVRKESYQSGDTDFQAVLTSLVGMDFDILYVPGYYTETGLIIQQARSMGIEQPIMGGDGYSSETLVELAGKENADNVYYTTHFSPESQEEHVQAFIKAYQEKYGKAADAFAALGYDSAALLVDAIERAGSTDREAIQKALAETKDFKGVTGTFSIDENHNPTKKALVIKLEKGEIAKLDDASPATP